MDFGELTLSSEIIWVFLQEKKKKKQWNRNSPKQNTGKGHPTEEHVSPMYVLSRTTAMKNAAYQSFCV